MSARVHQAIFVVALIGVFVAGVLSLRHFAGLAASCPIGSGCDVVAASRYAVAFGLPVATWGGLVYVALAGLAYARAVRPERRRSLRAAGLGLALLGVAASAALTYLSVRELRTTCAWCLLSGALLSLLLGLHVMSPPDGEREDGRTYGTWLVACVGAGLIASAFVGFRPVAAALDPARVAALPPESLIPSDAPRYGPPDAVRTAILFADPTCPACAGAVARLRRWVDAGPGRALVYRWVSNPGHPGSREVAALTVAAAREGRFWSVLDRVHASETGTPREVARANGLDFAATRAGSPERARVVRDEATFRLLGGTATPTVLSRRKGEPAEPAPLSSFAP